MSCCRTLASALALLATAVPAQTTWIVDALNGPGTNYLDLPPAVAAAAPGDIVLVRWVDPLIAVYTGPTITRELTIVGVGGQPGIVGDLTVQQLPAGEHVVLRDLQLAPFSAPGGLVGDCILIVRNNLGSVHLTNVDRGPGIVTTYLPERWVIADSGLVTLTDCTFHRPGPLVAAFIRNTDRVVMTRSALLGLPGAQYPTLLLTASRLVLVDSEVLGGNISFGGGGPAIGACSAELHLAGDQSEVTGGAVVLIDGFGTACPVPSSIVADPVAVLGGVGGTPTMFAPVPALGAAVDAAGLLELTLHGPPSAVAVLAFGDPAASAVPLFGDLLYLTPSSTIAFDATVLDGAGRGGWQSQLPPLPAGSRLWLQGVTIDPSLGLRLTTAAVATTP